MHLFDSHCHLDFPEFDPDRSHVLEQCMAKGIASICIPATEESSWARQFIVANSHGTGVRQFVALYVALGLHPCFTSNHREEHLDALKTQLENNQERRCRKTSSLLECQAPSIVAIGEAGLDFTPAVLNDNDRDLQLHFFKSQLALACEFQLPMILHVRKAHDEILKHLRKTTLAKGGIIHAFSGSQQQAHQYIDLGFKLGFGGVITYPRAKKTRQLASSLPLDSIVLETDAPDMPLAGQQGKRNSPTQLARVAKELAGLRGESIEVIAKATTRNSYSVLDIEPGS